MTVYGNTTSYGDTPSYDQTPTTEPSTTDQVKDKAAEVKDQVQDKAAEVKDRARSAAEDQIDTRSTEAGDKIAGVADQARSVSSDLREGGNDTAARLVEQAAGYTERLGDYLRSSDATTIINDVEGFARRQPWAVVVGGLVAGFAASRLLRASRPDADVEYATGGGRRAYGTDYTSDQISDYRTAQPGYLAPSVDEPIYAGVTATGGYSSPTTPTTGETGRGL